MIVGLIPMSVIPVSAAPTEYGIWVNGEQFTSDNATTGIACGDGKATLDTATTPWTLTLDNVTITDPIKDEGSVRGIKSKKNLTVNLKGENKIELVDCAEKAGQNQNIAFDAPNMAVTFNAEAGASLLAKAGGNSTYSIGIRAGDITVNAKDITAAGLNFGMKANTLKVDEKIALLGYNDTTCTDADLVEATLDTTKKAVVVNDPAEVAKYAKTVLNYTVNTPVYENSVFVDKPTKVGNKGVSVTGPFGLPVDMKTLKDYAEQYILDTYGKDKDGNLYGEYEIVNPGSHPEKIPTTYGEKGINWQHNNAGKPVVYYAKINVKPYYTVTATIYENGQGTEYSTGKQISVKGVKGDAVDCDTIKEFAEQYIIDTYGSLDGVTYEIVKAGSNPTNVPQTYGVETTNWNNMQFYVAVVIDSDYTFIAVLNDNGTKNAAQKKQYGVMNDVIDYIAIKDWAQKWANTKYGEAANVVEIKSVSNTDDLPATLGDTNFNWWSPDKYYANVNVTSTYDVAYVLDGASFGGDKVTVAEFPTYTVKDAGTKTGYTFSGWYKTQEELDGKY